MKNQVTVLSHNYTGKSLTVGFLRNGQFNSRIVDSSHANWAGVEAAYKKGNLQKVVELSDVAHAINTKFAGSFVVRDGKVYRGTEEVHGYIFDRILFFMKNNLDYKRLVKFANNLWDNPSENSRKELFKFLDSKNAQNGRLGGFPITDDGCFLAYKGVRKDFYSITGGSAKLVKGKTNAQGQVYNGVGEKIEVERKAVDDNCNNTCSYGLHAGSWEYANGFKGDGRMLVVKINPKDVVSIPTDHGCQKLRTCAYEVLAEEGRKLDEKKDSNFERTTVGYHNKRDSKGRFATKARR